MAKTNPSQETSYNKRGDRTSGNDEAAVSKRGDRSQRMAGRGESNSNVHAHRTAKVVELVCSSTESFQDAIECGLEDASATTRGITGAHVQNMSVKCQNGKIVEYKVDLKVAFGVERTPSPDE